MIGRRKHFDRDLYNKYDKAARKYAKAAIGDKFEVIDNPKKMGVDLIVKKNDVPIFYIETEIKKALDKPFEYGTLQLPERKSKFCTLDLPTLFMLFSSDGSKYFCTWDKFVSISPLAEIHNKYMSCREYFFQVPMVNVNNNFEDAFRRHWRR